MSELEKQFEELSFGFLKIEIERATYNTILIYSIRALTAHRGYSTVRGPEKLLLLSDSGKTLKEAIRLALKEKQEMIEGGELVWHD